MSILVTGSIAYDNLKSPFGEAPEELGGSAVYFSFAASKFTKVYPISVVGEDFKQEHLELLKSSGVVVDNITFASGKSFRWWGEYGYDLNVAKTLKTELNVFENFKPSVPEDLKNPDILFLANIDPDLQMKVLEEIESASIKACDTMDFWISSKKEKVEKVIGMCNIAFMNEGEARYLTGETSLLKAYSKIKSYGDELNYVVIKRGEYGSLCFSEEGIFFVPGYLLEVVKDPTGAGDSFAGGMLGFIDSLINHNKANLDYEHIKQSVVVGTVVASYTVEEFGTGGLRKTGITEIIERYNKIVEMTQFEHITEVDISG